MFTLFLGLVLLLFQPQARKTVNTDNFHILYDKSISTKDIGAIEKKLEEQYKRRQQSLHISLSRRVNVYLYNSELKFKSESKSLAFDDGDFKNGIIYLSYPRLRKQKDTQDNVLARVVTKALINEVIFCPPWFVDAYAMYVGNDLHRFGDPAQVNISSFADLFEEYNRADRARDVKEIYAKLGFTIHFLIDRYGEQKVQDLFVQFKSGKDIETIFESGFGEKINAIEEAWAAKLHSSVKN